MNAARELLAVARMLLSRTRKLDERSNVEREVKDAIRDGDTLEFIYTKKDGSKKKREITPIQMFRMKGRPAVKGVEVSDRSGREKVFYLDMVGDTAGPSVQEPAKPKGPKPEELWDKGKPYDMTPKVDGFILQSKNEVTVSEVKPENNYQRPTVTISSKYGDFTVMAPQGRAPRMSERASTTEYFQRSRRKTWESREGQIYVYGSWGKIAVGGMYEGTRVSDGQLISKKGSIIVVVDKGDSAKAIKGHQRSLQIAEREMQKEHRAREADVAQAVRFLDGQDPEIVKGFFGNVGGAVSLRYFKKGFESYLDSFSGRKLLMTKLPGEVREYVKGMGNNVVGELLNAIETGEKKLVKLWTKNKPSRFDYYYNALVLSVNYVEDKPDYGISNTVKSVNRLNEDGVVFGLIDMSYVIPDTRGT
jgi:hypothetical protein